MANIGLQFGGWQGRLVNLSRSLMKNIFNKMPVLRMFGYGKMSIYLRWLEFISVLPRVSHLISNILKYRRKVTNRGKTDVLSKPLKRRIEWVIHV